MLDLLQFSSFGKTYCLCGQAGPSSREAASSARGEIPSPQKRPGATPRKRLRVTPLVCDLSFVKLARPLVLSADMSDRRPLDVFGDVQCPWLSAGMPGVSWVCSSKRPLLFPLSLSITLRLRPPSLSATVQLSLPPLPPRPVNGEPSERRELYLAILRVSLPKNHPQNPPIEPEIALVCFEAT